MASTVVNNFFSNLGKQSPTSNISGGSANVASQFFSQFPQQQVTAPPPIKQVQAPAGGFKIGDVVANIESGVSNAVNAVKNFSIQYLPETTKALQDLKIDPLSLKANPQKALGDYVNGIKDSVVSAGNSLQKIFVNENGSTPTPSQRVGAGLETAPRVVGAVLSPVTSLFTAANDIPVLGSLSKVFNLAFSTLGEGGADIGTKLVDHLPLSNQVKNDIKPGVQEIFALAAQLVVGGKLTELTPDIRGKLIEKFGVQDAMTIEAKAKELAKNNVVPLALGEHKPQELIDHVVTNDLQDTPQGKEMLKTAVEAKNQGQNVKLLGQEDKSLPLRTTSAGGTELPRESDAVTKPSLTETTKVSPSNKYLPGVTTAEDVLGDKGFLTKYNSTIGEEKSLRDTLTKVAGDREILINKKDIKTAAEKIVRKLPTKPDYSEEKIGDFLRSTIVAKDSVDAKGLLAKLKENANVVDVEDHTKETNPWGYEGINAMIKTDKGNLNEVQIHTPESIAVQNASHSFYEKWRNAKEIPESAFAEAKAIADKARAEFRNNNQVVYHGSGNGEVKKWTGKVAYFTKERKNAEEFAKIDKSGKLSKNPTISEIHLPPGKTKDISKIIKEEAFFTSGSKKLMNASRADAIVLEQADSLRKAGYDYLSYKDTKNNEVIVSINPYKLNPTSSKASDVLNPKLNTQAQTPVGEGKAADSRAYARVKERMGAEANLDVKYNKVNLEEDAKKAVDFIAKDPQAATRVSLGLEDAPAGQTERGITIATADKALRDGNIDLWNQIEGSGSLRQTRRGQEIVVDRGRFNDNSPHRYMADLLDRRLTKLGTTVKSAILEAQGKVGSAKENAVAKIDAAAKQLKEKLIKDSTKINMAQDLIDSLRC